MKNEKNENILSVKEKTKNQKQRAEFKVINGPDSFETEKQKFNNINGKKSKGKSKKNSKLKLQIMISIICCFILICIIAMILYTFFAKKKSDKYITCKIDDEKCMSQLEKAKQAFNSEFNIISKENTLNKLSLKSIKNYFTIKEGRQSSHSTLNKAIYDIFTLNESFPGDNEKDLYSIKYTTVITINSLCSKIILNSIDDNCELKKFLDLNFQNNDLRRISEDDIEQVKEAILPICIIEHTDSNIILSIKCPETLSTNLKDDIILAFQNIKPTTVKGLNNNEEISKTLISERDDKKYINFFDEVCKDDILDISKNKNCRNVRDIITDKEGNLISTEQISTSDIIFNESNKYSELFSYLFEDITQKNTTDFDSNNYKSNLKIIFDLIQPFLKQYYSISCKDIIEDLVNGNEGKLIKNLRMLNPVEMDDNIGINEESAFSKLIYGIPLELKLKIDVGNMENKNAKAITYYNIGEKFIELSHEEQNIKLNETLSKFITLSKAANSKINNLINQVNEPLLNLTHLVKEHFKELKNVLAFKDILPIFDTNLTINGLDKLPNTFYKLSKKLYDGLNNLKNDIENVVNNSRVKFEDNISSFLEESEHLLNYIFKNLTEVVNSLSSTNNKIVEISSYYSNCTDTSYSDIIQKSKDILDNYYIKGKKYIQLLIDDFLKNFAEKTKTKQLKDIQTTLDNIINRINKGKLTIDLANNEDNKNIITNLNNSNNLINEIIAKVQKIFIDSMNFRNEYFTSQIDINSNINSYEDIYNKAKNISQNLENNEFIDKIFDNIMLDFRKQLINLLNYMEKSAKEKFTFYIEDLNNSLFDIPFINELDNNLKIEQTNFLNFIKNENNEYLKEINKIINSFKDKNENTLQKIINDLDSELSFINLDKLNSEFNKSLVKTINKINNITVFNGNISIQYLTNVKNQQSTYITKAFINKYYIILKSFSEIKNYINYNFKNNLANKYKNAMNGIKKNLQSIKLNEIIKKYNKQITFLENHSRIIKLLIERFDDYFSDELFSQQYLPTINNYINSLNKQLDKIEINITQIYNQQSKLNYSGDNYYDYIKKENSCINFCKTYYFYCWKYETYCKDNYRGYNINDTNSFIKLEKLNFDFLDFNEFDSVYSNIYQSLSKYIITYNKNFKELDNSLELINQKRLASSNDSYLYNIYDNIKSILNDNLGNNLLNASYNYYKNEITQKLPIELDNILDQWKNFYDKTYEEINSNLKNFKSSIIDFYLLSNAYYNTYYQNISKEYLDSISNKLKNEFNYTIKYYYNLILSEVNQTFENILSNMPINENPFNEIINLRINEINDIYFSLINEINTSKDEILKEENQLNFLKVNESNFFLINSYFIKNNKDFKDQLEEKINKFESLLNQSQENSNELWISRFYLENSQNGMQIKDIYDSIDNSTFIGMQKEAYEQLIESNFNIYPDNLIKNIKNTLLNSNEKILNNFNYENKKYIDILQNKIYNELYTKENLTKEIKIIFDNGLLSLNLESKNKIYDYINVILNRIKYHLSNESKRLEKVATSPYINRYQKITKRMNDYKTSIYDKLYSAILSVNNDFYSEIVKKFYKVYLEKSLDGCHNFSNIYSFQKFNFLNISIDLKEIVIKNLEIIINQYKNFAMNQIDYLYNKKVQELDDLFDFIDMKEKINKEIDDNFNSILFNTLKSKTKNNFEEIIYSEYDLSNEIIKDIDNYIDENIKKIKAKILEMKGGNYLNDNFNIPLNFSLKEDNEFEIIKKKFDIFTKSYYDKELKEFKNIFSETLNQNYKMLINNFVLSFGKDFFDRVLNYNEIQKIKALYENLKLSLIQTIDYYMIISDSYFSTGNQTLLPKELKNKIYNLNNLDEIIQFKNEQIVLTINGQLNELFEETKNYIVKKFIIQMKNIPNIESIFNSNITTIIEQILNEKSYIFEDEYINTMKAFIETPFIEQYKKTINKETNIMLSFIEEIKEKLKKNFNKTFSLDSDTSLSDMNDKLNNTLKAIKLYNSQLESFKIPIEIVEYLNNFGQEIIYDKFKEIKDLLDNETKELIMNNLNNNIEEYKKKYSFELFENKVNEINNIFSNTFNEINNSFNNYGNTEIEYKKSLEIEMDKNKRNRLLEESDEGIKIYSQHIGDLNVDNSFYQIINSSILNKDFIQTNELFAEFDEKLINYINDIKLQNIISEDLIINNKENYDDLSLKLLELNNISLEYYSRTNSSYQKIKDSIINSINKIDEMIENCANITFKTISNKYIEIKDNFNRINNLINKEEKSNFEQEEVKDNYIIKTSMKNYLIENEFSLDIIFEEDNNNKPKVIGKILNKNHPKKIEIDFYSNQGNKGKMGRIINVELNNINLTSFINFDAGINELKIDKEFELDEYNIYTKFYEEIEIFKEYKIVGITFYISSNLQHKEIEPPENEKELETIPSIKKTIKEIYNF